MRYFTPCALLLLTAALLAAAPVDTLQYSNLKEGMDEAEVIRRIGPPDQVVPLPRELRRVRGGYVEHILVEWRYPGGGLLMDTTLIFDNGVLVAKGKNR